MVAAAFCSITWVVTVLVSVEVTGMVSVKVGVPPSPSQVTVLRTVSSQVIVSVNVSVDM